MNTYPVVDFLVSRFPAKSASEKPIRDVVQELPPKQIPMFFKPRILATTEGEIVYQFNVKLLTCINSNTSSIFSHNHTGEKIIPVHSFKIGTIYMESLIASQQKHSGEKPHLSPHCNYRTNQSSTLKRHIITHTGEKPQHCPHCDYRTNHSSHLKLHIKTHTGVKPQLCPHCDYRTNYSHVLKTHIRTHTGEKPQLCPYCDYRTNHSSDLKIHIGTHTGEKPQLCPQCDYRTNRSSKLKIHIRTHTGEKPQLCPHCDYRTNQSTNLKRHITTHTGEKPQLCPYCNYRTNHSSHLKIHIKTHTGEKPHLCPYCDYRTNYSHVLKIHIRTHTVVRSSTFVPIAVVVEAEWKAWECPHTKKLRDTVVVGKFHEQIGAELRARWRKKIKDLRLAQLSHFQSSHNLRLLL
ncbi:hypothetical protein LAZ67_14002788 [Cordylochernes scorpioides]|uniref:C2H2-type domain-containing protein n=1 Tax=Cordylochernes scorpioides TaxID=51811 RepID=A0ABY6L792_9ARAC|nr:hypothetical protein LAZ67_14002788 [Cordylochernes scorpioides]